MIKIIFMVVAAVMITGAILAKPLAIGWKRYRSR